jgi:hypothetical protein
LAGHPACGDIMKLQIEVEESTGTIQKAVFKVNFLHDFFLKKFRLMAVVQQSQAVNMQLSSFKE